MTSLTKKTEIQNAKFFIIADSKTCQVFWGFEQLSSAIDWGAMWLVNQLKYPSFFPDFQIRYIHRPAANVLNPSRKHLSTMQMDLFSFWGYFKTNVIAIVIVITFDVIVTNCIVILFICNRNRACDKQSY